MANLAISLPLSQSPTEFCCGGPQWDEKSTKRSGNLADIGLLASGRPKQTDSNRFGPVANYGVGARWMVLTPVLCFVDLGKSKTEREQLVLLAYRLGTREVRALAQPQH